MHIEEIVKNAYAQGMIQDGKEIRDLISFLKDKNIRNVLEIGTGQGGSFYLWCCISDPHGIKISVDDSAFQSDNFSIKDRNKKMKTWSNNVIIIDGDSHKQDIFLKIKDYLNGEEIDLLFIDGDHSYDGVKKDYEMYQEFVKDDGYIVFHDIVDSSFHRDAGCFVSVFWDELKAVKKEFKYSNWAGLGIIQKKIDSPIQYNVNLDENSIFIIGGWISKPETEENLKKSIDMIRKFSKAKILFVSHFQIPLSIQNLVDYCIIDKENLVCPRSEFILYNIYVSYWWENADYRVDIQPYCKHEYAIWTSWRNSLIFADYLGKENIIFIESDCVLDDGFFENFYTPLKKYKYCRKSFDYLEKEKDLFFTSAFSIKTKIAMKVIDKFKNKYSFYSTTKTDLLEKTFNRLAEEYINTNDIYNAQNKVFCSDEIIDKNNEFYYNDRKISIFFCSNSGNTYLFSVSYLNEKKEFFLCFGEDDCKKVFGIDLQPGWNLFKIGQTDSIFGDFLMKVNNQFVFKKSKVDILEDIKYNTIIWKNENAFKNYENNTF